MGVGTPADQPLIVNGVEARKLLGLGKHRFQSWVKAGRIPSIVDPDTQRRYYSRPALEAWALRNGEAA